MEHSQTRTISRNQRHVNNARVYPELIMTPKAKTEQEAVYYIALNLVAHIDEALTKGTRHYRNRAGLLLTTLDEVIHAILADDLQLLDEEEDSEVVWMAQELAA